MPRDASSPRTYQDFEHQNKGCPENSDCDPIMGLELQTWKAHISKTKKIKDSKKRVKALEAFRRRFGIPAEFYTQEKSKIGFRPLLFDSPCSHHRPPNGKRILKGISFMKSLSSKSALIWRDGTQIEVPLGELLTPMPVHVLKDKEVITFSLPLGDKPLMIKNHSLYVLKEEDDLFYFLKIHPKGEWMIEDLKSDKLTELMEKQKDVPCPKDLNQTAPDAFKINYCQTLWDDDAKKLRIMKLYRGCAT